MRAVSGSSSPWIIATAPEEVVATRVLILPDRIAEIELARIGHVARGGACDTPDQGARASVAGE
jgi:hypothetical protein